MPTSRAVIPTFNMAIGFDVASTYFTPIWTRFLIAPLSLSFHRASPRLGRCAKHNSKTGFPGLEAQHLILHEQISATYSSDVVGGNANALLPMTTVAGGPPFHSDGPEA